MPKFVPPVTDLATVARRPDYGRWGYWGGNIAAAPTGAISATGMFADMSWHGTPSRNFNTNFGENTAFLSASSSTAYCGIQTNQTLFSRGLTSKMIAKIGISSLTDVKMKVGFASVTATSLGAAFDDSLDNIHGALVGFNNGATEFRITHNDGGVTPGASDTGISNTGLAASDKAILIEVELTSSVFNWKIRTDVGIDTGSVDTDLPSLTTQLYALATLQNSTTTQKTMNGYFLWGGIKDEDLF